MLILSRRPGDAVIIDGGIRIVVLANDGRSVRLGIEAPSSVGIVREEIVTQIADENRRASAGDVARTWADRIPLRAAPVPVPSEEPETTSPAPAGCASGAGGEP